ncbi:hypothetical protein Cylst_6688 (plasmid) [Cylindrospermum stagnale PCC 7417]|uniref:HEAT repeat domain-containing protein n=2 Tax=Cylindrospermum stagnale TaxID=142864 RepID=K9X7G5_9NOST|nr:hypothetical protein Cylst_6688 [Cylindrospermum stagnale PCC 7417]
MLCQAWYFKPGNLPETKAALYQQFVENFYQWKPEIQPSWEERQELEIKLGKLALKALKREKSRFGIEKSFACEIMGEPLFRLAEKLHWLIFVHRTVETNEEIYVFFHPTFQEYFSAYAISRWEFFLNHNNQEPNPFKENHGKDCVYRIFDPHWKEVILLWLGLPESKVSRSQKEEFICALVTFNDGCRNFYWYRSLFLAALGLAEFSGFSATYAVIALLISECCVEHISLVEEEAREILLATDHNAAIFSLTILCVLGSSTYVKYKAAYLLGQIDSGNKIAISTLTELIHDTEHESLKLTLAKKLSEISSDNLVSLNTLLDLSQTAQDNLTRRVSTYCLEKCTQHRQDIISHFIRMIKTLDDKASLLQAVHLLGAQVLA